MVDISTIAKHLFLNEYPVLVVVIIDWGLQINSHLFCQLIKLLSSKRIHTTAYHPETNSHSPCILYIGPFKILKKYPKYFTGHIKNVDKNISSDNLKPAFLDATWFDINTPLIFPSCVEPDVPKQTKVQSGCHTKWLKFIRISSLILLFFSYIIAAWFFILSLLLVTGSF